MLHLIEQPLISNRTISVFIMVAITLVLFFGVVANIGVMGSKDIFIFALLSIVVIFSLLHTCEEFTVTLLKSIFCFFVTYMLIVVSSRSIMDKSTFDFIYFCTIFASILFLAYYFSPIAYLSSEPNSKIKVMNGFTANLSNPNYTGMVMLGLFYHLLINLQIRKNKFFILVLMTILLFLIYQTQSRACIISAVVVVIYYIFFKFKNRQGERKVNSVLTFITMLIPVAFICVYLGLYYGGASNIEFIGKPLFSGRELTYVQYLNNVKDFFQVLFGNLAKTQFNNAHNGPLSIFTSIGLIGLFLVYLLYIRSISSMNKGTIASSLCIVCILSVFIQSSVEAAFFVGGTTSIVEMGSLFLMASYSYEETKLIVNNSDHTCIMA